MQMNREGLNIRIPGNEMPKTRILIYDYSETCNKCCCSTSMFAVPFWTCLVALILVPGSFCMERGPHCVKKTLPWSLSHGRSSLEI